MSQNSFADFRSVDSVWLPFKTDITWNGQSSQNLALDNISVNSEIDPALFEKPKQGKAQ